MRERMKKTTVFRWIGFILLIGLLLSACQMPGRESSSVNTNEDIDILQADPNHLVPCGEFEKLRLLQPPDSTTSFLPNATPAAIPTLATPLPAPMEDRIGFPENFATDFKLLFVFDRPDRRLARAVCGNDIAAQHKEGEP